jgi:hypothetical protein
MGDYYEVLNQRNRLQKQLNNLKEQHKQKINKLYERIEQLQDQNHYYKKYIRAKREKERLYHEKWILTEMLKQFKSIIINNETIQTLLTKAEKHHEQKFGFNKEWRIEI